MAQPSPSNRATGTDEVCSLLLPLSANDPLFDKKKKVLLEKGFSVNKGINFTASCLSHALYVNLDLLLQRARIIHLNEMELYFGEINVNSQSQFYSPRNELEALNYIVSCIDNAPKNSNLENSALHDLRAATVLRIHEFGETNQLKTRVVEYSCEKETSLWQWAQSNGNIEGAGRGALAADDLNVGDIALEIPLSIIISEEVVHMSDMFHELREIEGISAETMLLLWSMRERHNSNSKYKIYFDTLPEKFNTGLSFGLDAILALEGTLVVEEILQAKEHLRTQYDELFPVLCDSYPELFPPESYTWEQYLWGCELWYSNSMRIMFADGSLRTCLIPVAGFLNHSIYPHIMHYGKADPETNTVRFPLSMPCKAGQECFLGYGNLSSSHLLTFYGFFVRGDNPCDVIPLDFGDDDSCCETAENSSTHMVRGTWLSKNHDIFYYGLPTPLLDKLRRFLSPCVHTMTLENLENELRVLEEISCIFKPMIEGLGDPELDESEGADWDVRLALDFKDLQRCIISSVISSCVAGREMVQQELNKCMAEDIAG
ncbi:hypothetical protein V2J09_017689 [Rumex salicifolius]